VENFIGVQEKTNRENDEKFEALDHKMKNIKNQVAQQASVTYRQQGQILSKLEKNSREQANRGIT
jgi:hypothetical protein